MVLKMLMMIRLARTKWTKLRCRLESGGQVHISRRGECVRNKVMMKIKTIMVVSNLTQRKKRKRAVGENLLRDLLNMFTFSNA